MIPYADFERAIARWKIRRDGGLTGSQTMDAVPGAVAEEMPLANAEPVAAASEETQALASDQTETPAGGAQLVGEPEPTEQ